MDETVEVLEQLQNDVQTMRENGESDLRSVLYLIELAIAKLV
ncbi:hypothetical protein [Sporosarcina sp. A2]